jgi:hypothetical protein
MIRRLTRFSLRALLVVVTLFCLALGYGANWKHQRIAYLANSPQHPFPYVELVGKRTPVRQGTLPLCLRLVGEPETPMLLFDNGGAECRRAEALFPEAMVVVLKERDGK